jgi:GNAT superfamily N-acetyltransferase
LANYYFLTTFPGKSNPRQIGLARLITDDVSFAYLTDVYVLEEFQGKGLGAWLIESVEAHISQWPELRRVLLLSSHSGNLYEEKLGVKPFSQGESGMQIFSKVGKGSPLQG